MPDPPAIPVRPWHHLILGTSVAVLHMLYYLGWSMDDPYITYRYLEHWVTGQGLVYNAGDPPVEGFSNFLWMVLLVPWRLALGMDWVSTGARLWGFALALATGPLLALTWQRTGPPAKDAAPLWRWLPLHTWALSGPAMFWAVGELEAPLAAFLMTVLLFGIGAHWDHRLRTAPLMALVLLALAMTRPEGAMYGVALFAAGLTRWGRMDAPQRRAWIFTGALFASGVALYTLWRWHMFGSLLPNTFHAKVGGSPLTRLLRGFEHDLHLVTVTAGLPVWALLGLWAWPRGAAVRAAALFAAVQFAFITYVGGDWMPGGRFLVPVVPCLLLLATAGMRRSWDGLTSVTKKRALRDLLILALLVWVGASLIAERIETRLVVTLLRTGELHRPLFEAAEWIERHAEPEDTLAGEEAGFVPFVTGRRFLDLLALNDRHLASLDGDFHSKMDVSYVVDRWRPDWIILLTLPDDPAPGQPATALLAQSEAFQSSYTEVHQIPRLGGEQVARIYQRTADQEP